MFNFAIEPVLLNIIIFFGGVSMKKENKIYPHKKGELLRKTLRRWRGLGIWPIDDDFKLIPMSCLTSLVFTLGVWCLNLYFYLFDDVANVILASMGFVENLVTFAPILAYNVCLMGHPRELGGILGRLEDADENLLDFGERINYGKSFLPLYHVLVCALVLLEFITDVILGPYDLWSILLKLSFPVGFLHFHLYSTVFHTLLHLLRSRFRHLTLSLPGFPQRADFLASLHSDLVGASSDLDRIFRIPLIVTCSCLFLMIVSSIYSMIRQLMTTDSWTMIISYSAWSLLWVYELFVLVWSCTTNVIEVSINPYSKS
jgi:hypothetical protein